MKREPCVATLQRWSNRRATRLTRFCWLGAVALLHLTPSESFGTDAPSYSIPRRMCMYGKQGADACSGRKHREVAAPTFVRMSEPASVKRQPLRLRLYNDGCNGVSGRATVSNSTEVPVLLGEEKRAEQEPLDSKDPVLQSNIRDIVHQRPEHFGRVVPRQSQEGPFRPSKRNGERRNRKKRSKQQSEGGTLGDIMSSGLVTVPRLPLAKTYGFENPLDRMVLTANGNLQRLISSYYDSAVSVDVDHCTPRRSPDGSETPVPQPPRIWDRVVRLTVLDQTFCTATSIITVRDPLCVTLVESGQVGLGQLFRYLDLLPEFALVDAGRYSHGNGGFWREYTLECPEVSCLIHEEFIDGLWKLDSQ